MDWKNSLDGLEVFGVDSITEVINHFDKVLAEEIKKSPSLALLSSLPPFLTTLLSRPTQEANCCLLFRALAFLH